MTITSEALGTIRHIGPISVNVGNHTADWAGPATAMGREFSISGSLREPETARALLGMCQSIARWFQPDGPLDPSQLAERYVQIALAAAGAVHVPPNRGVRQRKSATPGTEAASEKRQPRRRSAARSQ